jgi:hypothetical protein
MDKLKIKRHKSNWIIHIIKISINRMPEVMLIYRPNGRRRLGRPLNGLLIRSQQV